MLEEKFDIFNEIYWSAIYILIFHVGNAKKYKIMKSQWKADAMMSFLVLIYLYYYVILHGFYMWATSLEEL